VDDKERERKRRLVLKQMQGLQDLRSARSLGSKWGNFSEADGILALAAGYYYIRPHARYSGARSRAKRRSTPEL